jgi:hypothetical protein
MFATVCWLGELPWCNHNDDKNENDDSRNGGKVSCHLMKSNVRSISRPYPRQMLLLLLKKEQNASMRAAALSRRLETSPNVGHAQ